MSIKNKLKRLKNHIQREEESSLPPIEKKMEEEAKQVPFLQEWKQEHTEPFWVDDRYCLIRKVRYPLTYKHGKYTFQECVRAVEEWNKTGFSHPLSTKGKTAKDLFFFDTETTGLGGGVGNMIFLLGYAQIKEEYIELTQHILPQPGAEVPLFASFLENVDYTTLVTYNGKAFDWPQVKTRHTLVKEHVPKLPQFGHFDLYHAARRMWKHRLERTKLSFVEKDILEVERKDDIPGFLAPMIYFDFVERKNPEGMFGIIKHNEIDILSLITLYTHLSFQLLNLDEQITAKETYEVGRWYSTLGETQIAKKTLESIHSLNKEEQLHAMFLLAAQCKREHKWQEATDLWAAISEATPNQVSPLLIMDSLIELAKVAEHKEKNYLKALNLTKKAEKLWNNDLSKTEKRKVAIDKRKTRLEAKVDRLNNRG